MEVTTRNIDDILPHDGHSHDDFVQAAVDDICENRRAVADEWKEKLDGVTRDLEITRGERDASLADFAALKAELKNVRRAAIKGCHPEVHEILPKVVHSFLFDSDPELDKEIADYIADSLKPSPTGT